MKSIFTLILGLFLAISSFSQSESLLASVEIISAPEVEMEKDTTFAFVSECDSLEFSESMDDKYSWLTMSEFEFDSLETSKEISCPLSIKKITYTDRFDFSVSDIDRTPDSVKEFVESVNDSTIFIAETDGKFFSVNSFDNQYESIIVADTIVVDDRFFVFDSTQVASIKEFINANYVVGQTDTVSTMMNLVSGYTEDEELAMFARYEEEMVQNESVISVDEKSIIKYVDQKEEAQFYFASYSSPVERVFAKQPVNKSASAVEEGEEYSSFEIFFIIFLCVALAVFLLLPIVTIAFGEKILPYLSYSGKRLVVKWEAPFMRFFRHKRKSYQTEPAEEGARAPSS